MNKLVLKLAEEAPIDALIAVMQQLCLQYAQKRDEKTKQEIITLCEIIAIKDAAKSLGGFEKMQETVEKNRKAIKFFTPEKN